MVKQIDLDQIPQITVEDLVEQRDEVLAQLQSGEGPILICHGEGRELLFRCEEYFERYGAFYTDEEREAIEAAARNYREETP